MKGCHISSTHLLEVGVWEMVSIQRSPQHSVADPARRHIFLETHVLKEPCFPWGNVRGRLIFFTVT